MAVLVFLLLLVSSVHTEARLSKFLTKNSYNFVTEPQPQAPILAPSISVAPSVSLAPEPSVSAAPSPAPVEGGIGSAPASFEAGTGFGPAPAPAAIEGAPGPVESAADNPYGLYSEFSSRKTTTFGNEEDEFEDHRLGEYSNYNNERYSNNYYYNKGHGNGYYINGYENNEQKQGMSDTRFLENGNYFYDVNSENHERGNTNNVQSEGMSDTRFLENGKYFSDVNYENGDGGKMNGYESVTEKSDAEGNNGYGEKSKYEFDSMEEYERQQGYPDTDKLFNP